MTLAADQSSVARACRLLERWTGFELRGTAPQRVSTLLEHRAAAQGYKTAGEYVMALEGLGASAPEPQRLVNLMTNGLTAFWRDEPQLEALASVMRSLHRGVGARRPLRIWCAGCSTGEEAYTAAMIAQEHQIDVRVVGTDINTDFLAVAARGRYSDWSLRRLSKARQAAFFQTSSTLPGTSSTHRSDWLVRDALRASVEFRRHNLLRTPPEPQPGACWDIILCRNVLIYFSTECVNTVLSHFASRLTDDGYLLLGSSEQLHTMGPLNTSAAFRAVRQNAGFVYRLTTTSPGNTFPPGNTLLQQALEQRVEPPITPPLPPPPGFGSLEEQTSEIKETRGVHDLLNTGATHMAKGEHEAALACFEAASVYDPFVPETHCLIGYTLQQLRAPYQALEAFRKTLFLDPHHWFAAARAGQLYEETGERARARQAFRQALEGLDAAVDPVRNSDVLPHILGDISALRQSVAQLGATGIGQR